MCVIHIGKVWFESRFESPSYMVPWMAESCRKWCLVFIGFAIKLICRQCLKMRECSFLEGKLSLCGLPWKSGRWAGWVFLGRNVTAVGSSSYEHCWELLWEVPLPLKGNTQLRYPENLRGCLNRGYSYTSCRCCWLLVQIPWFVPLVCVPAWLPTASPTISLHNAFL